MRALRHPFSDRGPAGALASPRRGAIAWAEIVEDVETAKGILDAEGTKTVRQIRLSYLYLKKIKYREMRASARMIIEQLMKAINPNA